MNAVSPDRHYTLVQDIRYGSEERLKLDVYQPTVVSDHVPVVVFLYGGGWKDGEKSKYEFVASSLAKAGYVVVIPDYRLYPAVVFPEFVNDGADAVAWALRNANRYGGDTDNLFVIGHSAGAHIGALLSLNPDYLEERGFDLSSITGFIGLSGPYDFLPINTSYLVEVFPEDLREASQPVNYASAEVPPVLLIHGNEDTTVRAKNSQTLADKLVKAGAEVELKIYDGAGHVKTVVALAPPLTFLDESAADIQTFISKNTKSQNNAID
ncbi:MAG: alpha/beta hydrolase [Gammaproteobacteria bacterium]